MIQWLDHPFVDLLTQTNGLLPYFMTLSRYLASFLLFLSINLAAIKYAITHQGFKEDMIKTATALVLFVIIINAYPKIITGINRIAYKMAITSTYTKVLAQTIDKTRNNSEFWAKKGDKLEDSYSDIIKKVAVVQGGGQIGYKYVLDLYLPGTGYMSPSALMRVVMLILDNILSKANSLARNSFGIVKDMSGYLMLLMTALCVLFAGLLGFGQYFIAAIEFQMIAAVGVITLPGMLWNSTKFLTEKLIGAILGFFIKMLFVSIAVMLMFNGLLILMTQEFSGAIDQLVRTLFSCFIYVMFCQFAPSLAVSLLTGSPQMSLGEAGATAATLVGGTYAAGRVAGAVAGTTAKGGTSIGGGMAKTIGASVQGAQEAASSGRSIPAALGAGALRGATSAGHSVLKTAGSVANSIGKSLIGRKTENKHSSLQRFQKGSSSDGGMMNGNSPSSGNADVGKARSIPDYFKAKFNEGRNFAKGKFGEAGVNPSKPLSAGASAAGVPPSRPAPVQQISGRESLGLPGASAQSSLPSPENTQAPIFAGTPDIHLIGKHGLSYPPPSATPSRLALPPPQNQ